MTNTIAEKHWGGHSFFSLFHDLIKVKKIKQSGKTRLRPERSVMLTTWQSVSAKFGTNFTDKRWLLGQYSSFTDSGHGVVLE
jgi:hypothetical protein